MQQIELACSCVKNLLPFPLFSETMLRLHFLAVAFPHASTEQV